jgi:hypothetical protein
MKSTYCNGKIALLRQLLENNAESGTPVDYEIRIDGMKVVPRTNKPEAFDNHEDFITEDTKTVLVIIYDGSSRRSTRHLLTMKEEQKQEAASSLPAQSPGLSGVEIERMMEDKLKAQQEAWEHNLLKKENRQLKEQLEEAETHMEKLGEVIEAAKSNGNKIGGVHWGDIAGIAVEGIIKRNAHLLSKIPGAEHLAGIIAADNKAQLEEGKAEPECKVTFKAKKQEAEESEDEDEEEDGDEEEENEEERDREGLIRQLQTHFKKEERVKLVFQLLNQLIAKPEVIEPAIIFINQWKVDAGKAPPKTEIKQPERKEVKKTTTEQKAEPIKAIEPDQGQEEYSFEKEHLKPEM